MIGFGMQKIHPRVYGLTFTVETTVFFAGSALCFLWHLPAYTVHLCLLTHKDKMRGAIVNLLFCPMSGEAGHGDMQFVAAICQKVSNFSSVTVTVKANCGNWLLFSFRRLHLRV
jgi:hypothetical protein